MQENKECVDCKFKSSASKLLGAEELGKLENNCARVKLKKGELIFKQGVLSSNIVYLKSGVVKLHMDGPNKEQIIKIVKGPTHLGIPTTFDEKYNHYSATTVEKTEVCYIDIKIFKQFIQDNGKFAYEIILELCQNEISIFHKCISRSQKNARGRIADALLFFSKEIYESPKFNLPLTRNELGGYVDTTRESSSRILAEFGNEKIIKLSGKKVEILNFKQLELISKTG